MRTYSFLDRLLITAQQGVEVCLRQADSAVKKSTLSQPIQKHSASLMRINHVGEVCAQGLYHGGALAAQSAEVRCMMEEARLEEIPHLELLERRLGQLSGRVSILNPFWYTTSLLMGLTAGWIGDEWSLGFVEETELQVAEHLRMHLKQLSIKDQSSRKMLNAILIDELEHASHASSLGAKKLPKTVKKIMGWCAEGMRKVAYYL